MKVNRLLSIRIQTNDSTNLDECTWTLVFFSPNICQAGNRIFIGTGVFDMYYYLLFDSNYAAGPSTNTFKNPPRDVVTDSDKGVYYSYQLRTSV